MAPIGYRVPELTRDRLLLVGDAAGYLSPITGQGIEFAMRSARLAATVADKALRDDDLSQAVVRAVRRRPPHRNRPAGRRCCACSWRTSATVSCCMRCPDDRDALHELLGPIADLPGEERGNAMTSSTTTITPVKFAHVVFRTPDLDRLVEWYCTVLNAHVAMKNDFIAFLTYDDEHHRVAMVLDPRITETDPAFGHPGVDHVSYTYESLEDLVATYERLKDLGIEPYWTIDHGPTTSLYYRDPDGNQVELQIDNFDSVEALHEYFRSGAFNENPIGTNIEIADLVARVRHGTA